MPLKVRRRGWKKRAWTGSDLGGPLGGTRGKEPAATHRLLALLEVAAPAHQAELVLGVLLRSGAGGPVHQRAGPGVVSGHAFRVLPATLRGSEGAARSLARLNSHTALVSVEQQPHSGSFFTYLYFTFTPSVLCQVTFDLWRLFEAERI